MSRINNQITTTFTARGGNVVAALGQMGSGARNFGQVLSENTRMSERFNNQWKAIQTTLRYSIAGGAVFGLTRMVSQLRDVNNQLGQMQALSGIGGTMFSDRQVTQLGNDLQKVAVDTITPLQDVNEAAINFLSTVQNVQPSDLPAMLTQIGEGAKLAQTPMEDLTQAATTFQIAFGRAVNPQTIGQVTNMWTQLIGMAPGGVAAAPTIAQQIPGLASMFQLAPGKGVAPNVAQAQLMSLTLGALRTGMPAATAMRGLTYLLQSVAQPTGGARKALAGIGITPQTVEQQGIYANVMKLLQTISARPGEAKRLGAMTDESIDFLEQSGGNLPGIPASEMVRLRAMIPRIHGVRAAIILASQLQRHGDVQSLPEDLNIMLQDQNDNSEQTMALKEAWKKLSSRSRLQQATVAVNAMGIQIAQAFNPLFDLVSKGIVFGAAPFMQHHRHGVGRALTTGAAVLGAIGMARMVNFGNLPGIKNLPGARFLTGGGRGLVMAETAQAAIRGGTTPGTSPQNPLFVIVVGEVFGGADNPPTGTGNPITDLENDAKKGRRGWPSFFGKIPKKIPIAGAEIGLGTALAGTAVAAVVANMDKEHYKYDYRFRHAAARVNPKMYPNLARLIELTGRQDYTTLPENQQNLLKRLEKGEITPGQAARIMRGRADVNVQIQQVDANGKVIQQKRVHVPVDMWQGGSYPRSQGSPGNKRK